MRMLTRGYRALLKGCLRFPLPVYLFAAAGLGLLVVAYGAIGKTFMPTMDEGAVIMQITKHPSINLQASIEGDLLIQRALKEKVPEVERIVARVGSDELGLDPMGLNETDTFMVLKPKDQWRVPDKAWLVEQLRTAMADLPGYEFAFTQPIEMRTAEMLTGSRGDLAIKIFGPDLGALSDLAAKIQATLRKVPGAAEVSTVANDSVDYMQIDVDRLTAGRTGLSVTRLQDELRSIIEGAPAGLVAEPGRRTNIVIRGTPSVREDPNVFAVTQFAAGDGGLVRVGDVARLERVAGPIKIDRENASRFAVVQAYVSGRDLVGFVEDAQRAVAEQVPLPQGYRLVWGGQFENQRRAATRLSIVVPIALVLIFGVLVCDAPLDPSVAIDPCQRAVCPRGRDARLVAIRRVSVGPGLRRLHCPAWHCRAQRSGSGQPLQRASRERPPDSRCRVRRSGAPAAARDDDCQHRCLRARAAAVCDGARLRNPETTGHCGDRRARELDRAHTRPPSHPVPALWRCGTLVSNIRRNARMDQSLCKITFVCPPDSADHIAELMLSFDPPLPGFTTWMAEGHGFGFGDATVSERVRGRVKRSVIVAVLDREIAAGLLDLIATKGAVAHLTYWTEPVDGFGQMRPTDSAAQRDDEGPDTQAKTESDR